MRVLIANLKLLYQRRDFLFMCWVLPPLLVLQSLTWILGSREVFFISWAVAYIGWVFGLAFVAMTMPELMGKPFLHCLPSHQLGVRKALFVVVFLVSSFATGLSLMDLNIPADRRLWVAASIFSTVAVCHLAFTDMMFISRKGMASVLGFWPFLALILFSLGAFITWKVPPEHIFIRYAPWITLGGILLSLAHWVEFGRWDCIRQVRASRWLWRGIDFRQRTPVRRESDGGMADRAESKVAGVLGSYLLRRMGTQPYLGYGRYVWGAIYTTLCPLARWGMWFVVPSALVLLACGYLGRCFTWVFVIALSWLLALLVGVASRPPVVIVVEG